MPEALHDISRLLLLHRDRLADAVMARHWEIDPDYAAHCDDYRRAKCIQDVRYHIMYLANAIGASTPSLFSDYIAWAKVLLHRLGVGVPDVDRNLEIFLQVLEADLPAEAGPVLREYVGAARDRLLGAPLDIPTELPEDPRLGPLAAAYSDALLSGDRRRADELVRDAFDSGASLADLYLGVFQPCQLELGRLWQLGRISVAQEHYCTAASQLIMARFYPHLFEGERNGRSIMTMCVGGELHEFGARMVSDFFEMAGWDTYHVGASTPTESVLGALADRTPSILGISATMSFHIQAVTDLISAVRSSGVSPATMIMVGGYPFNHAEGLWRQVGADGYAPDGLAAVEVANALLAA